MEKIRAVGFGIHIAPPVKTFEFNKKNLFKAKLGHNDETPIRPKQPKSMSAKYHVKPPLSYLLRKGLLVWRVTVRGHSHHLN